MFFISRSAHVLGFVRDLLSINYLTQMKREVVEMAHIRGETQYTAGDTKKVRYWCIRGSSNRCSAF